MTTAHTADDDLLHAWREGDRSAGSELFGRHFASVQRFFRHAAEPDAIDDLVQATFVACVEGRDRFEGRASFRSYLFGVAHNLLRSHYRGRHARAESLDFELTSVVDLGLGPASALEHKREQRVLIEALRRIPLDSQILLQLRYWEQLRTAELAEFLGLPRGTAVDRLRRARAQLEQAIARLELSPDVLESTIQSLGQWAASLRRKPGERDEQLAKLLPERLGRRPIVARTHGHDFERASYRGQGADLELKLSRLDPDRFDAWLAEVSTWTARAVGTRPTWLRFVTEPERIAELRLVVGRVAIELRVQPAAGPEQALEAIAELALEQLQPLEQADPRA